MATTRRRVKVRCVSCGTRYKVDTSSESSVRRSCPCGGDLVPDDGATKIVNGEPDFLVLEDAPPAPPAPRPPAAAGTLPGDAPEPRTPEPAPVPEPDEPTAAHPAPAPEPAAPKPPPRESRWLMWVILLLAAAAAGWWIWRIVEASA